MEALGKKHFKLAENLDIDHLDNSFIYKYISEVKEYLLWGDPESLKKYKKETPGQVVEGKIDKVTNGSLENWTSLLCCTKTSGKSTGERYRST